MKHLKLCTKYIFYCLRENNPRIGAIHMLPLGYSTLGLSPSSQIRACLNKCFFLLDFLGRNSTHFVEILPSTQDLFLFLGPSLFFSTTFP